MLTLMNPEKDAGPRFRLARGPAHDDACGADLDDAEPGGGNIVAIETAARVLAPAGMQAAVGIAHIEVSQWRDEFDQSIPDTPTDRKG